MLVYSSAWDIHSAYETTLGNVSLLPMSACLSLPADTSATSKLVTAFLLPPKRVGRQPKDQTLPCQCKTTFISKEQLQLSAQKCKPSASNKTQMQHRYGREAYTVKTCAQELRSKIRLPAVALSPSVSSRSGPSVS